MESFVPHPARAACPLYAGPPPSSSRRHSAAPAMPPSGGSGDEHRSGAAHGSGPPHHASPDGRRHSHRRTSAHDRRGAGDGGAAHAGALQGDSQRSHSASARRHQEPPHCQHPHLSTSNTAPLPADANFEFPTRTPRAGPARPAHMEAHPPNPVSLVARRGLTTNQVIGLVGLWPVIASQ